MAMELIAKIKPKNGGAFALVDAEDVEMPDGSRLSEAMEAVLPAVTTDDNGKLLQVVDGAWAVVAVADSAVAAYVDTYINEALGGEY